jgi:hypothetical protein
MDIHLFSVALLFIYTVTIHKINFIYTRHYFTHFPKAFSAFIEMYTPHVDTSNGLFFDSKFPFFVVDFGGVLRLVFVIIKSYNILDFIVL